MSKTVYKLGIQSEADPWEFVMSTDEVDRVGDIIEQDWKLKSFKANPISLWMHDGYYPIGSWSKLRKETVDGVNRLVGRLNLAAEGTSELIDTLRKLVEQRILKAVSVGLRASKVEPIDEDKPWNGYRLSGNELFECSLVSIGANQSALSTAKAFVADNTAERLLAVPGEEKALLSVAEQLGVTKSRDSDGTPKPKPKPKTKRKADMSLSDKILAKQKKLDELKNQLTEITEGLDDLEGEEAHEEANLKMEELSTDISAVQRSLETMQKAEKALMLKTERSAVPAKPVPGSADGGAPSYIHLHKEREKGFKAFASFACMVKAHHDKSSPIEIAKAAYKDDPEIAIIVKAATDPATMTDAAWAAPLVRETWGEFMDLIRDISIYPRLPGIRLEFDRYGKITLPKNVGRGQLAGSFVGEGKPIPVREGAYGGVDLTPKKLAVISVFTREIGMHSMPAIQGLIQSQMLEDTAESLDGLYLDAEARDTLRPAGMQDTTETGAGNINGSSGTTVAAIIADTQAMVGRMIAARTGSTAVWCINPLRVLSLRNVQDAASGEFVFRAEIAAGTFQGYPLIISQNVPDDLLLLQSDGAVAFANDYAPAIEVSDQATIVFDDTVPDDVLPDTNTQPVKSMFQTDSIAVKMHAGLDWRISRIGGVQILTGVDW